LTYYTIQLKDSSLIREYKNANNKLELKVRVTDEQKLI